MSPLVDRVCMLHLQFRICWSHGIDARIVSRSSLEHPFAGIETMARAARAVLVTCSVFLLTGTSTLAAEPELIERLPGPIDDHSLVMRDTVRAFVAWERDDSATHEAVWTSRRGASGRWTVPEIVEFSQGHAREVQLGVDAAGTATVVWVQEELGLSGLWSNRYVDGEGWRDPVRIEPVGGELYAPRLAVDRTGHAFAVWERRRGDRLAVRASRYTPQNGWSRPRDIDSGVGDAVSPRVALHADGSAVAAWTRREVGAGSSIVARYYRPETGWDETRTLSDTGGAAYDVEIAMDGVGDAVAAWEQKIRGEETVFASRFEMGGGWSAPVRLEIDEEEGYGPRLAVGRNGGATVAWIRADGESGVVAAAHYAPGRGWRPPVVVHGGELLYLFDLELVAGARGSVLAAWCQTDGSRNNVWYARFDGDERWGPATLAEHRTGSAHRPRIAAAPDGGFGLLWKMVDAPLPDEAIYSLWFRRLD